VVDKGSLHKASYVSHPALAGNEEEKMADPADALNLKPEHLVRVYVDISREIEQRLRIRTITLEAVRGKRITRREYLEELILKDLQSVTGASLREVKARK
jgi:hypothetical protein